MRSRVRGWRFRVWVDIFVIMFSFSVSLVLCTPSEAFSLFLLFIKSSGLKDPGLDFRGLGFKVGDLGFGVDIFANIC